MYLSAASLTSASFTVRDFIDREWGLRESAEMAGLNVPPVALAEEAQRQLEREDRMMEQAHSQLAFVAPPSHLMLVSCLTLFAPSPPSCPCCLSRGRRERAVQMSRSWSNVPPARPRIFRCISRYLSQ